MVTLPWGNQTLRSLARHVRSAENRILIAEKFAAMAAVWAGARWPRAELIDAWDQLLRAQHHDGWIVCTTRSGRQHWGWQVNAETWVSEDVTELCAHKFLYARDESMGVELDDEYCFPSYVRNSRAWALWKDDLEASAPIRPDPDLARIQRRERALASAPRVYNAMENA